MKFRRAIELAILIPLIYCRPALAAGAITLLKVSVTCSTDDSVGSRLCFAVKEKIRASRGFELVDDQTNGGTCVIHIVSVDTGDNGNASAVATVYTVITSRPYPIEAYLTTVVHLIGTKRVEDIAEDVVADLEQDTDFLRK
jgi:hypothetical protein